HSRHNLVLVAPSSPGRLVDIAEIEGIAQPYPHLVTRADRHPDKAGKLRFRALLATITFGKVGTDGFGSPPDLVGQSALLHRRKGQAHPMDLERYPVRALEHFHVLKRRHPFALTFHPICP